MEITQRRVVLGLLILQMVCALLMVAGQVILGNDTPLLLIIIGAVLASGGLLAAYYRGWEYARHINVVLMTLVVALGMPQMYVDQLTSPVALIPPALALILAGPSWILGSACTLLAIYLVRGAGITSYTNDLRTLASTIVIVGCMYLSRLVADHARQTAERHARQAAEQQARAEQQALALAEQAGALLEQTTHQQRLLDLVATLEAPAVTLADGVVLVPMVGYLDHQRAAALTQRLLGIVSQRRAQLVLLDIAGVAEVGDEVAGALLRTTRALRLLGCQVAITGISPAVALVLTRIGVDLRGIITARAPQEVLEQHRLAAAEH